MSRIYDVACTVERNSQVLPGVRSMVFRCDGPLAEAGPGQFVQVEVSGDPFPVTRRPFTVNSRVPGGLEILYDVVGSGTSAMASIQPGSEVKVLGPLGHGWDLSAGENWLLVGGGLGAAGFQYLIDTVKCSGVILGASSSDRVVPLTGNTDPVIATEDGSMGVKGLVTHVLNEDMFQEADVIAVCGPVPMMEAVWNVITEKYREKVQVSTESRMGCGWGVCDGCSIPVVGGGYRKCCTEGPVFPGIEIDWKRWKEAGL